MAYNTKENQQMNYMGSVPPPPGMRKLFDINKFKFHLIILLKQLHGCKDQLLCKVVRQVLNIYR
jgi:hypothetical protein